MKKTCRPAHITPSSCSQDRPGKNSSIGGFVRQYMRLYRPRTRNELESFSTEPTLEIAVKRAGLARRPDGKRYDHQRLIPLESLKIATERLLRIDYESLNNFDNLHETIRAAISPIHRIGELTVYDTALRIGARLGLYPRHVYLHRGTREGAKKLKVNWKAKYIEVHTLPRQIRTLEPYEIEDFLCIYAKYF